MYLRPLLCKDDSTQNDLYFNSNSLISSYYVHSDGRCVYIPDAAEWGTTYPVLTPPPTGTELDYSNPIEGCIIECELGEGITLETSTNSAGGMRWYIATEGPCWCTMYACNDEVEFEVPNPAPLIINITTGDCAGTVFRLIA